jgi:hypothetical protein
MKFSLGGRKVDWKKWGSIFLVLITLGSSGAYSILQAFQQEGTQANTGVTLPTESVINYELSADQKTLAYKLYKTILEFRYPLGCADCASRQAYLESLANAYPSQLILQEISDNSLQAPILFVSSYFGSDTVRDPSSSNVLPKLCDLMYERPLQCATLNLPTTAKPTTTIDGNVTGQVSNTTS